MVVRENPCKKEWELILKNKILFCIYYDKKHYDYDFYVQNCIASLQHYSRGQCSIIIHKQESIESESKPLFNNVDVLSCGKSNNIFMWLDDGMEYALEHGFEYVYLLPANIQFVRDPTEFLLSAVEALSRNNLISIISGAHMSDKVLPTYPLHHDWQALDDGLFMKSEKFGFCHTGLIRLETLENHPFRFGNATWKALNSWFLARGLLAYSSAQIYSVTIPWVLEFDSSPKIDLQRKKFYMSADDERRSALSLWEDVCQFSDKQFGQKTVYWSTPEHYTQDLLKSNKFIYYSRRIIQWLLPKKWRYYLLMLCEG